MAKEYENAALICLILSALSLIGIAIGIWKGLPVVIAAVLIPTIGYEIYRTEGFYTKGISIGMLALVIVEIVMLVKKGAIDISKYVDKAGHIIRGRELRLLDMVDVNIMVPAAIAVLALMLIRRTGGRYTIWLAVIILVTSVGLIYSVNPLIFKKLLGMF